MKRLIMDSTPMETMIDDVLVAQAMEIGRHRDFEPSALNEIAQLFRKNPYDLWREYRDNRDFTKLHDVLLGIDHSYGTLEDCLMSLAASGILAESIDITDSRGRSALAWAVEYSWADAVEELMEFGANIHQQRLPVCGGFSLLHLAIAGPSPQGSSSQLLDVVRVLIEAGVDINATDQELWTPLHIAASWNLFDVLLALDRLGGWALNWKALTDTGQSALDLAIGCGADKEVVDLLSIHQMDITI
jgi:Ankyrin repeats (many copies)